MECKRKELNPSPNQPRWLFFYVFKARQTEDIAKLMEDNNIHVVSVPANCTDRLRAMDLCVNKPAKSICEANSGTGMQCKFNRNWLKEKTTPIDLRMPLMKPLGARWLVSLYNYLNQEHPSITSTKKFQRKTMELGMPKKDRNKW